MGLLVIGAEGFLLKYLLLLLLLVQSLFVLGHRPTPSHPMPFLAVLIPPPTTRKPPLHGLWKAHHHQQQQLVVDNSAEQSTSPSPSSPSSASTFFLDKSTETGGLNSWAHQGWLVSRETGQQGEKKKQQPVHTIVIPPAAPFPGRAESWSKWEGAWEPGRGSNVHSSAPLGQCLLECADGRRTWDGGSANNYKGMCGTASASSGHKTLAQTTTTSLAEPFYYEYEADQEITQFGRCNVSVIRGQAERIVIDLLFYTAAAWVPFWAFLCIAVNLSFRQFGGHHRWLDFYQELGFILLFPFLGVFVLKPQLGLLCPITTMVLLFCLVFILVIGFLQAYFASSLIKGTSLKDGRLPVAVNYVWPLALAAVPVGLSLWLLRHEIGTNRVHCSAPIFSNLFWVFVVPAWLLWLLVLVRNQLSITACKQSRPNVDREQLYWARKSVKGTPLLLCWFLLTFFTQLFAVDMQLLWLCVLFAAQSLVLGPLLFLLHTHNHQRVNNAIFERTQMGLYRPCPLRRQPVAPGPPPPAPPPPPPELLVATQQQTAPPPEASTARPQTGAGTAAIRPVPTVVPAVATQSQPGLTKQQSAGAESGVGADQAAVPGQGGEANAQQFYEWLTDTDERNLRSSERVLWPPPRPV